MASKGKMPTFVKILLALVAVGLISVVGLVSCTGLFVSSVDSAIAEVEKGEVVIGPDGTEYAGDERTDLAFAVGDAVTVGDLTLTVGAPKNRKPGEFDSSKSGNFAVFPVTVTNNGTDLAYASSGDFGLYVNDTKIDEAYIAGIDFVIDDIAPGKTVNGELAFDLKKGSRFEVIYTPSFVADQQIRFTGSN